MLNLSKSAVACSFLTANLDILKTGLETLTKLSSGILNEDSIRHNVSVGLLYKGI